MGTSISFPSIEAPDYPLERLYEDAVIRTDFENGTEQTRPRFTRTRDGWHLKWKAMSQANYDTLHSFYDSTVCHGALSFNWTHPTSGVAGEYRFASIMKAVNIEYDQWAVEIPIREV